MVNTLAEVVRNQWGKILSIAGILYAIYGAFFKEIGDILFGLFGSAAAYCTYANIAPRTLLISIRDILSNDKTARYFVIASAIGGTALVVDTAFKLSLLNEFIDPWAKRLGLPILLTTLVLYIGSWVAKKSSVLNDNKSDNKPDGIMIIYEQCLYLFGFIFVIFSFLLLMGIPIEDFLPSCKDPKYSKYERCENPDVEYYDAPDWFAGDDGPIWKLLLTVQLISFVWFSAASLCIFLRYFKISSNRSRTS